MRNRTLTQINFKYSRILLNLVLKCEKENLEMNLYIDLCDPDFRVELHSYFFHSIKPRFSKKFRNRKFFKWNVFRTHDGINT